MPNGWTNRTVVGVWFIEQCEKRGRNSKKEEGMHLQDLISRNYKSLT